MSRIENLFSDFLANILFGFCCTNVDESWVGIGNEGLDQLLVTINCYFVYNWSCIDFVLSGCFDSLKGITILICLSDYGCCFEVAPGLSSLFLILCSF